MTFFQRARTVFTSFVLIVIFLGSFVVGIVLTLGVGVFMTRDIYFTRIFDLFETHGTLKRFLFKQFLQFRAFDFPP